MTHQAETAIPSPLVGDAGGQVAQLRHVLAIVEGLAGSTASTVGASLDEAARLSAAYADALPIDRRRFDLLAAETAAWAAAGVEALISIEEAGRAARAAAERLARELGVAIGRLSSTLAR